MKERVSGDIVHMVIPSIPGRWYIKAQALVMPHAEDHTGNSYALYNISVSDMLLIRNFNLTRTK